MSTETSAVSHRKPIGYWKGLRVFYIARRKDLRSLVRRNTACDRINEYVFSNAEKGDVKAILQAVDKYCKEVEFIMHLGKYKAERFTEIVKECYPTVCLELGTYCGYSALLLASLISDEGKIYTIEFEEAFCKAARELIEYAGMSDKITVIQGDAGECIKSLRDEYAVEKFDFVFIDHHKPLYKRELVNLEEGKYLRTGTVIVGDDLGWPGAPLFDEYIQTSGNYDCNFYDTRIEMFEIEDVMAKAVYKGE